MTVVDVSDFGMFLRPTGKGHGQRYGDTRCMGYAGRGEDGRIVIDTGIVIALSHWETNRYRREYKRQIKEGAVEKVDAKAYQTFVAASHEAEAKAAKASEALAKKAAEASAKADAAVIDANDKALKKLRAKQAAEKKKSKKSTGSPGTNEE